MVVIQLVELQINTFLSLSLITCYGYGDHRAIGCRLEKQEEMQRFTVRQKDVSEIEEDGLQNGDKTSNSVWDRNMGYNEVTRTTD